MSDITVARRYAEALYEESARLGQVEQIDADMELIRASMEGSRELVRLFESPVVSREKKETIIRELFEQRLQALTLRFLLLLVEKQRENIFPAVVRAHRELRDRQQNIVEAHARVAQALGADDRQKLSDALARLTGQSVRLAVQEDASLLGGVVVRLGDTVYDGSVRHQLEEMREQLHTGRAATPTA